MIPFEARVTEHSQPNNNQNMSTTPNAGRSVALIGSSGGGTATLGHTQPSDFVNTIELELQSVSEPVEIGTVLFVSLDDGKGMDSVVEEDQATLFHQSDNGVQRFHHGTLNEINQRVQELDVGLANDIQQGNIQGLISVSCKPSLFSRTLRAAAEKDLPVTGTGGTSLASIASEYKVRLVGNAGGSVATTSLTKAISFSHALAQTWDLQYMPWKPSGRTKRQYPAWRSVLNSSLPAFWGVALCKRLLLTTSALDWLPNADMLLEILESYALPTVCAVVMANSRRKSPSVLMGAVLAASACRRTILGGLLAGWMVSFLEERLLYLCIINWNVPATMTNLLTTGFVGVLVALLLTPFTPYLSELTGWFRTSVLTVLLESRVDDYEYLRILTLSMLGSFFCYGSKVGWYHSIFLPIILVEMELGDAAILGTMDQLALVLVGAGICAGTWITASVDDVALVKRGLVINLFCGDFIEACYPIMEQNVLVSLGGYLASACSVAILTSSCKSSGYLPFPVAIWLADDWRLMSLASMVAMGVSFAATVVNHFIFIRVPLRDKKD
jgi:hypothetical protein